ncbi:MAG: cardiolipin synthase ClsB [Burkholderiaceae bacterium]
MKPKLEWISGNRVDLLENGDAFFSAVFDAIDAAEREVLIETFILFEDRVGRDFQQHLISAAARSVEVDLTVDGFGSPDLSDGFISVLTDAGAWLHVFEPTPLVRHLKPLRRLHRKIIVVDGRIAYVGGINFSEDHLESFGAKAKQDYAVRIEGPVVERIHRFARQALEPVRRQLEMERPVTRGDRQAASRIASSGPQTLPGSVDVAFLSRDNHHHRTDIERAYRMAIRTARDTVLIANAYFFPGYRLLRDLRRAAARGVKVQLILQSNPDVPIARVAGRLLYESLMRDGVLIHEYCRREMHGKVAVVDRVWSTVGSTNLDPLSLSLNLEANVLIRDAEFAATLQRRLQHLIEHDCEQLKLDVASRRLTMWRYLMGSLAYHVSRGFPRWLRVLPYSGARIRSFVRGRRIDTTTAFDASANRD